MKILLVDDHALFRVGMRQILEADSRTSTSSTRPRIRAAPSTPRRLHTPDIVLLDLSLPAPGGIETTQRVKREVPERRDRRPRGQRGRGPAVRGHQGRARLPSSSRTSRPTTSSTIIRRVNGGEYLINDKVFARPSVANRVLKEFRELAVYGQEAAPIFAPLSPREVEILDNIAKGMTNKQVAYALSISEQTVKNHMSSILRKLSVNDRTQAVVYAMKQGWIRIPED